MKGQCANEGNNGGGKNPVIKWHHSSLPKLHVGN